MRVAAGDLCPIQYEVIEVLLLEVFFDVLKARVRFLPIIARRTNQRQILNSEEMLETFRDVVLAIGLKNGRFENLHQFPDRVILVVIRSRARRKCPGLCGLFIDDGHSIVRSTDSD